MREYPLRAVEATVANGESLESIEHFIEEDRTRLSSDLRSALWLLAWTDIRRENRSQRGNELTDGEPQSAGRLSTSGRVDCPGADESVAGRNQFGLGIGD